MDIQQAQAEGHEAASIDYNTRLKMKEVKYSLAYGASLEQVTKQTGVTLEQILSYTLGGLTMALEENN